MRKTSIATLLSLAALFAGNASAQQPNLKPGLWQVEVAMPGQARGQMAGMMAQIRAQMASMPPEQRKALEKSLADLDASGTEVTDNGVRMRQCITRDDIARYDLLGKKAPDSCTRTSSPTAGGAKLSMTCTRPQMAVEGSVKFQGDKAYTFESVATVAGPDGKPVAQKSSGSGQWLGSDCGKTKPGAHKG
jgi:hypothetical protein